MARHTSVSWNLMIGRNPLLVAKEHGHRPTTMLSVYAAWLEGAMESDIAAIREAMNRQDVISRETPPHLRAMPAPAEQPVACARRHGLLVETIMLALLSRFRGVPRFDLAVDLPVTERLKCGRC